MVPGRHIGKVLVSYVPLREGKTVLEFLAVEAVISADYDLR